MATELETARFLTAFLDVKLGNRLSFHIGQYCEGLYNHGFFSWVGFAHGEDILGHDRLLIYHLGHLPQANGGINAHYSQMRVSIERLSLALRPLVRLTEYLMDDREYNPETAKHKLEEIKIDDIPDFKLIWESTIPQLEKSNRVGK